MHCNLVLGWSLDAERLQYMVNGTRSDLALVEREVGEMTVMLLLEAVAHAFPCAAMSCCLL